jgi:hypothetical protein
MPLSLCRSDRLARLQARMRCGGLAQEGQCSLVDDCKRHKPSVKLNRKLARYQGQLLRSIVVWSCCHQLICFDRIEQFDRIGIAQAARVDEDEHAVIFADS